MSLKSDLESLREAGTSADFVLVPADEIRTSDVLLGRGKCVHFFPGNVAFRLAIKAKSQEYNSHNCLKRDAIAREIIDLVHSNGGRFLQKSTANGTGCESNWTVSSRSTVRTKVKQALRDDIRCGTRYAKPSGLFRDKETFPSSVDEQARRNFLDRTEVSSHESFVVSNDRDIATATSWLRKQHHPAGLLHQGRLIQPPVRLLSHQYPAHHNELNNPASSFAGYAGSSPWDATLAVGGATQVPAIDSPQPLMQSQFPILPNDGLQQGLARTTRAKHSLLLQLQHQHQATNSFVLRGVPATYMSPFAISAASQHQPSPTILDSRANLGLLSGPQQQYYSMRDGAPSVLRKSRGGETRAVEVELLEAQEQEDQLLWTDEDDTSALDHILEQGE